MALLPRFRPLPVLVTSVVVGIALAVAVGLLTEMPHVFATLSSVSTGVLLWAPVAASCLVFQGTEFASVPSRLFLTVPFGLFMLALVVASRMLIACSLGNCF